MYEGEGTVGGLKPFPTTKHRTFEIMCGKCYHLGMTKPREANLGCEWGSIIGCYWQQAAGSLYVMNLCCPHKMHETRHYCENCGVHIATAPYITRGGFLGIRRAGNPWRIDSDEDPPVDFRTIKAEKLVAKAALP